ncbi:F-box domain-containing protein [Brazilian cedratvirus IHUMI]|uniref:F-box domain-containing protein n=1 Tax=Brazilian cedratvirus IHUMI TaxID=2126980 RepID=A0A2R8FE52_9VIRU|nr:F-box domain-containing protein [Brazilian cedratvirus IHUMI]
MQDLPREMKEEILLGLQGSDFYEACYTCTEFNSILGSPAFWRTKFTREGLYMMERGDSPQHWIDIYLYSREVMKQVSEDLKKEGLVLQLNLYRVPCPDVITVGCVDKDKVREYLEESSDTEGIEKYLFRIRELQDKEELDEEEDEELSLYEYKLESYKFSNLQIIHNNNIIYYLSVVDGHREEILREDIYFLTPDELEFLLYKIHYYVS